jgi:hypothetical protein
MIHPPHDCLEHTTVTAHRFGPAREHADNKLGLRGRCQRLAPRARLSIMARSSSAPPPEAGDTTAVEPSAPQPSRARRISLWEESRYAC